jgi:hypothetical protein
VSAYLPTLVTLLALLIVVILEYRHRKDFLESERARVEREKLITEMQNKDSETRGQVKLLRDLYEREIDRLIVRTEQIATRTHNLSNTVHSCQAKVDMLRCMRDKVDCIITEENQ